MKFLQQLGGREDPTRDQDRTAHMFLGAPEAEAETGQDAKIHLADAFEDHFGVLIELHSPKFIVSGRKGSGKSAIGEYLSIKAASSSNIFVTTVRKADVDLESLLQIASPLGTDVHAGILLEWIILVKLATMLIKNNALAGDEGMKNLQKFFDRNSGMVALNALEFKSLVTTQNGELSVGLFSRALLGVLGRKIEFKSERAQFFKLVPHLKDVVLALLKDKRIRENHVDYMLIFDDLDIGLNSTDDDSMLRLGALIRLCRDYNKLFSADRLSAKLVVLLRDDIAVAVSNREADLGKIIQSYESRITWWSKKLYGPDENNSEIKKFITRRLSLAFRRKKLNITAEEAWAKFLDDRDDWNGRTSFKHILDYTLYRPRDLLLMFLDIAKLNLKLPIDRLEFEESILPDYAIRLVTEWRNELLFALPLSDVNAIFNNLPALYSIGSPFRAADFERQFKGKLKTDHLLVLEKLFKYSVIGHIDSNMRVFFSHRQNPAQPVAFDASERLTFHKAIMVCAHAKHSGH